jgi:hypothetical protein
LTESLGQSEAKALKEPVPLAVGLWHPAKPYPTLGPIIQQLYYNVGGMNSRKLGKDGAGRIAQPGTGLPLLECSPNDTSEEADQNERLDTVLL